MSGRNTSKGNNSILSNVFNSIVLDPVSLPNRLSNSDILKILALNLFKYQRETAREKERERGLPLYLNSDSGSSNNKNNNTNNNNKGNRQMKEDE